MDLAIDYYTLALNYTPSDETDLKGIILSNRSLMHKKRGSEEEALSDAQTCVENTPNWAKVRLVWRGGFEGGGGGEVVG